MGVRLFVLWMLGGCWLAGCDRIPLEPLPSEIRLVSPTLDQVYDQGSLVVFVEVALQRPYDRVTFNDVEAARQVGDRFAGTVLLSPGLTPLRVQVFDGAAQVGDTVFYAVHLPSTFERNPLLDLPEPLGGHTTTLLADGTVLVAGGAAATTALATGTLRRLNVAALQVTTLAGSLLAPRVHHTATRLPDGRVLFIGGARTPTPRRLDDLVNTVEIFNPATQSLTPVVVTGAAIERTQHGVALGRTAEGRPLLVLVGGRGQIGTGFPQFGLRADQSVHVLTGPAGRDTLRLLSPAVGPTVAALAGHTLTPFTSNPPGGSGRHLLLGTTVDAAGAIRDSVGLLLTLEAASTTWAEVPVLRTPRVGHATAPAAPGLLLTTGGVDARTQTLLATGELFVEPTLRRVALPADQRLATARAQHTATFLPNGRILLAGGFDAAGNGLRTTELYRPR